MGVCVHKFLHFRPFKLSLKHYISPFLFGPVCILNFIWTKSCWYFYFTARPAGGFYWERKTEQQTEKIRASLSLSQSVSFTASSWTSTLADNYCPGRTNIEIRYWYSSTLTSSPLWFLVDSEWLSSRRLRRWRRRTWRAREGRGLPGSPGTVQSSSSSPSSASVWGSATSGGSPTSASRMEAVRSGE